VNEPAQRLKALWKTQRLRYARRHTLMRIVPLQSGLKFRK